MKKIVLFTTSFQVYSKGDVAGFDVGMADELINKKKVAVEYQAPAGEMETLAIKVNGAEAETKIAALVEEATAKLAAREAEVKEREDRLAEAEKALAVRSDALDAREVAAAKSDADKEATTVKPPKQGVK
ncbi:MAG: hypothetical protein ACPGNV_14245 [Mangrovicoccus sp.]